MGKTSIEWATDVWNPVVGCSRVSEGCRHCYAERQAFRCAEMGQERYAGLTHKVGGEIRWTGQVRLVPEVLEKPLRWKKPRRVFVNSMSDLFHESLPDSAVDQVFAVMARAAQHTFQVLTKRPERMLHYFTDRSDHTPAWRWTRYMPDIGNKSAERWDRECRSNALENVWLGVSVEDQATADARIPLLLQTPAAIRFVSYEPALGPVDFRPWLGPVHPPAILDQIIVGGESGHGARPFDIAWARSVVKQCREAGVACFVKQVGRYPFSAFHEPGWSPLYQDNQGQQPSGEYAPVGLNAKGGNMDEWPDDLRVREWPAVTR